MVTALIAALATGFGGALVYALMITRLFRAHLRESSRREQADRAKIAELVDRTMYMADRPWTPPPVDLITPPQAEPEDEIVLPEMVVADF